MKLTKNRYLLAFSIVVALLFVVKLIFPDVNRAAGTRHADDAGVHCSEQTALSQQLEAAGEHCSEQTALSQQPEAAGEHATPLTSEGVEVVAKPHPIHSVPNYQEAFPDTNGVQLVAAERWGVRPVRNREDAEKRMKELVYMGVSPYYHVDRLNSSIPYLVPRAAMLLQDIGRAFYDSLYVKGVPFNQLIVTSVLRTMDDVEKLRRHNGNATERSCHLYGTTFDICYNRYEPVVREVRNDTLKWVLSEVLRDMREQGRCYLKYEVKQGCFHMTVR